MKIILAGLLLLGTITGASADVLDNWTTNQVTTNYFGLAHVVYGNGHYVAVGEESDSGGVYTSDDGLNWVLRFTDLNSWGLSLTYSQGRFVGVGGITLGFSTNGIDWTVAFRPDEYGGYPIPAGITYGNNLYVLVSSTNSSGSILTSPDGVTWTARIPIHSVGGPISSVAYGAYGFVAVGNNDGAEYYSHSGTTWLRLYIPGGNQVSYANGLYFVPLSNNSNLVSSDAVNWSMQNTGLTNMLGSVIYANGIFLARAGNYLATSTDGTSWIQYPQPLPGNAFADSNLATDGTRLVTVDASYIVGSVNSYNGFAYTSDVLAGIRTTSHSPPQIAISGLVGRNYQIQSTDVLPTGSNNWRTNLTFQLAYTPYVWSDNTATNATRFYRGVLLP